MPYSLQIHEEVRRYLRSFAGLSREGRFRLFTNLDHDLRIYADIFR